MQHTCTDDCRDKHRNLSHAMMHLASAADAFLASGEPEAHWPLLCELVFNGAKAKPADSAKEIKCP